MTNLVAGIFLCGITADLNAVPMLGLGPLVKVAAARRIFGSGKKEEAAQPQEDTSSDSGLIRNAIKKGVGRSVEKKSEEVVTGKLDEWFPVKESTTSSSSQSAPKPRQQSVWKDSDVSATTKYIGSVSEQSNIFINKKEEDKSESEGWTTHSQLTHRSSTKPQESTSAAADLLSEFMCLKKDTATEPQFTAKTYRKMELGIVLAVETVLGPDAAQKLGDKQGAISCPGSCYDCADTCVSFAMDMCGSGYKDSRREKLYARRHCIETFKHAHKIFAESVSGNQTAESVSGNQTMDRG